ncbi:hypothetical protein D3C76_835550 [compost metagenome]|uniref:Type 1 fimbrial protein n=1 Tax=Pseudomonas jinjuensis TaxID=198616 RepID=A0A1G9Z2D2_9PSED|nr:hypothetical protein [Pseudomonas jinjuensis]SDN15638.1 hypothetical protein SAMN05216193_101329 [Pseudomonas jinjuensis]
MSQIKIIGALLLGCSANALAENGIIRFHGAVVEPSCIMQAGPARNVSFQLGGCSVVPQVSAVDPGTPHRPVRITVTELGGQPSEAMDDGLAFRIHGQSPKNLLVRLDYL